MTKLNQILSALQNEAEQHQKQNPSYPRFFRFDLQKGNFLTIIKMSKEDQAHVLKDTTGQCEFGDSVEVTDKDLVRPECTEISEKEAMDGIPKQTMRKFLAQTVTKLVSESEEKSKEDSDEIDWNSDQMKYAVYFDFETKKASVSATQYKRMFGAKYTTNKQEAQDFADMMNADLASYRH